MIWTLLACAAPAPAPAPPPPPLPPVLALTFPVSLADPLPCAPGCVREERVRQAVGRGLDAIEAALDTAEVKLDLLIGLEGIDDTLGSDQIVALQTAWTPKLDSGGDPRRRFWDPDHRMAEDYTPGWVPDLQRDVSPNGMLVEALYCREQGFRPEVTDYVCEKFRDGGGLLSAHAAWGLGMAVEAGCVERQDTCLDAVRDEVVAAALTAVPLDNTLALDTLAEQLLFGLTAGADPMAMVPVVDRLLDAQQADGSLAVPAEGENPWWGVHATLAACWGWSDWLATR